MNPLRRFFALCRRAPDARPVVPPLGSGQAPNPSTFRLGRLALHAILTAEGEDMDAADAALKALRRELTPEVVLSLVELQRAAAGDDAESLDDPLLDLNGRRRVAFAVGIMRLGTAMEQDKEDESDG